MRTAALLAVYILSCLVACVVVRAEPGSAAQRLIDDTATTNVQHLDLLLQPHVPPTTPPWFVGFGGSVGAGGVAVATIGHPLRRMLLHLRREGVELKEGMSWAERGGHAAYARTSYRQGYQVVDNYLVRVLAGQSAWGLPPGRVGNDELQAARIALGKFEVILRAECLAVDLPLLQPYLAKPVTAAGFDDAARETEDLLASGDAYYLVFGKEGHQLLRDNRWDLQLWDFALKLVESRSTTREGYLCGSSTAARSQRMPGEGKRAVVYNTPSFHITGVAMFSCVLMSLGFDVTAVIKDPGTGFRHLLPCPNTVVTLKGHYLPDVPGEVLDEETAVALGLSPGMTLDQQERQRRQQLYAEEYQRVKKLEEEEEEKRQEELLAQQQQQQGQGGQEEEEHGVAGGGRRGKRRNRKRELSTAQGDGGSGSGRGDSLRTRRDEPRGAPDTGAKDSGATRKETRAGRAWFDEGTRKSLQQEEGPSHEPRTPRDEEEEEEEEWGWRSREKAGRRSPDGQNKDGDGVTGGSKLTPPAEDDAEAGEDEEGVKEAEANDRDDGGQSQPLDEAEEEGEDDPRRTFEDMVWGEEQVGFGLSWGFGGQEPAGQEETRRRRRRRRRLEEGEEEGSRSSVSVSLTGSVEGAGGEESGGKGLFDLSVLCTVISDINHLMKPRYPVDPRLVDALLWDVDVSIWNLHSVEGAFRNEHRMPPAVEDFVRGVPSMQERGGGGRTPPLTFLTLYGEHVEQWDRWSEEAYEGWGWDDAHPPNSHGVNASIVSPVPPELAAAVAAAADVGGEKDDGDLEDGYAERGNSTFGAIFRRPGVVYPIHPTGHLRLPRPKRPFGGLADAGGGGDGQGQDGVGENKKREEVIFVVQGNMQSNRRDYPELSRCLEAMCSTGRENYQLVAVGARGDLPDDIRTRKCVENRTTEWRHLEYPEFYANISAGHFVVTAAAGHDYEYDKATSTVPTALLLERPLVMSSVLLDAYPCLRKARVHSMVANDDLCVNLQAAYDLSPEEYDEMELEARDCKLEMWHHARETVAGMASGWTLD